MKTEELSEKITKLNPILEQKNKHCSNILGLGLIALLLLKIFGILTCSWWVIIVPFIINGILGIVNTYMFIKLVERSE